LSWRAIDAQMTVGHGSLKDFFMPALRRRSALAPMFRHDVAVILEGP